jgi:7-keto-8-aminopelargonate synthetase-like enzyme
VLEAEPGRVARLRANGRAFLEQARAAGIDTGSSAGASVIPAVCGGSVRAVRASRALLEAGVNVQPIIHPAVEERAARLRFFVTSEHREADIAHTVALLAEVLGVSAAAGAGGPEGGP